MANSREKWKFARVNEKYPLAEKKRNLGVDSQI